VQANLLFYVAVDWEHDFTAYVVDYGTYRGELSPLGQRRRA
jgi:hypothetical protein